MKIFISCPFSSVLDKRTNLVKDEYRYFFEKLTEFLDKNKIDYYLAITRENWGQDYISANDSTYHDYEAIKESDILFVIPGNPISGGVHVELGWASSLKKKIHLFLESGVEYSPVVNGLEVITKTEYHKTDVFPSEKLLKDMIEQIRREVKKQ